MATIQVQPRNTPGERDGGSVEVDVAEELTLLAAALEDWAELRPNWELQLREGHDFGRADNVEARLVYADGPQSSSLTFRLDQLRRADDTGQELVLVLEEQDGIAKLARLTAQGLDVELFHILTFT